MPISTDAFLASIAEIQAADPRYKLGHDGDDGFCDCIGLIIGAIRRAGGSWTGTHGSNFAARNEMRELVAITSVDQLQVGMAVYKRREPGDNKYALPSGYKGGTDLGDYYHVGVVISVAPLRIMHCTGWTGGSGIKIDTSLGTGKSAWRIAGRLKRVNYIQEGGENIMDVLWVGKVTGGRLSLRKTADKDNDTGREWIPDGAQVKVLDMPAPDGWAYAEYNGMQGYCMAKYLQNVESIPDGPAGSVTVSVNQAKLDKVQQTVTAAQAAMAALKDAMADFMATGISAG